MPADDVTTQPLALGVDLGTGSARAFAFHTAGRRLDGVRLGYTWRTGVDGTVEADADDVVDLAFRVMDEAVASLPADADVVAVGFSTLWHTLLGADTDGTPVTPVYAWSDTRATAGARALREMLDAAAVHARTGAPLHPAFPPAKLHWLRTVDPARFERVHRWLSLPEYLWFRLTGEYEVDTSIAAGGGLLDQSRMCWDADLLNACGIAREHLSLLVTERAAATRHGHDVAGAARWPALRSALWRMPVGDGACANVGSGCTHPDAMAVSIGTSAAVRVMMHDGYTAPPPALFRYSLDRTRSVLGGAISNGGVVRSWLRSLLQLPGDAAEVDALLMARPPAAHGLDMLPFLAGERSPDWPLDATAALTGLRLASSPLDVLQAGMEAVAYRLALLRDHVRQAAPDAMRIVASGGALRTSPYWPRLLADVFGEAVHVVTDAETSSRGAALLALEAAFSGDFATDTPPTTVIHPDPTRHAAHDVARKRQRELEERLR